MKLKEPDWINKKMKKSKSLVKLSKIDPVDQLIKDLEPTPTFQKVHLT